VNGAGKIRSALNFPAPWIDEKEDVHWANLVLMCRPQTNNRLFQQEWVFAAEKSQRPAILEAKNQTVDKMLELKKDPNALLALQKHQEGNAEPWKAPLKILKGLFCLLDRLDYAVEVGVLPRWSAPKLKAKRERRDFCIEVCRKLGAGEPSVLNSLLDDDDISVLPDVDPRNVPLQLPIPLVAPFSDATIQLEEVTDLNKQRLVVQAARPADSGDLSLPPLPPTHHDSLDAAATALWKEASEERRSPFTASFTSPAPMLGWKVFNVSSGGNVMPLSAVLQNAREKETAPFRNPDGSLPDKAKFDGFFKVDNSQVRPKVLPKRRQSKATPSASSTAECLDFEEQRPKAGDIVSIKNNDVYVNVKILRAYADIEHDASGQPHRAPAVYDVEMRDGVCRVLLPKIHKAFNWDVDEFCSVYCENTWVDALIHEIPCSDKHAPYSLILQTGRRVHKNLLFLRTLADAKNPPFDRESARALARAFDAFVLKEAVNPSSVSRERMEELCSRWEVLSEDMKKSHLPKAPSLMPRISVGQLVALTSGDKGLVVSVKPKTIIVSTTDGREIEVPREQISVVKSRRT